MIYANWFIYFVLGGIVAQLFKAHVIDAAWCAPAWTRWALALLVWLTWPLVVIALAVVWVRERARNPARPHGVGAPLELSPELQEAILLRISQGAWRKTTFLAHGVPPSTIHHWEARAAQGEEPYASFWVRLLAAEAKAEYDLTLRLRGYGQKEPPEGERRG